MRPSAVVRGSGLPAHEGRVLLAHVLGTSPSALPLVESVSDADAARLAVLAERRRAGEPLQHLTGVAFFRTVRLRVGPGVFIPRPETELMVEWALRALRAAHFGVNSGFTGRLGCGKPLLPGGDADGPPVVVELCAGSGAISKALAAEFPGPSYHAVELSADAWPYLVSNLAGTGVRLVHGDMADALPELNGRVDLVIANPPYVPESARAGLPPDVLRDPEGALFAGPEGLDALRVVVATAGRLLKPGGWVVTEHDDTQGESVPALFAAHGGFTCVADHPDLAGRARFAVARRASARRAGRIGP